MENMARHRIIGFDREMKSFTDWLADAEAKTSIFSISGIGGIGKTTLLLQMASTARQVSVRSLWLDGRGGLATSGAFLAGLEMSLATEYGRTRDRDTALLPYIASELSLQPTVLLMDNCEEIEGLEGWLFSSFLPELKTARVLFVCASRNGLPLWQTNPEWKSQLRRFPLRLFTREEVYDYLGSSGLSAKLQREIAEKTDGHPLSLALTVDMLLSESADEWDVWREVPAVLSAEFLREAASPSLYRALTALSLLPAANEALLNRLLDKPLEGADYYQLTALSFVRDTLDGISLHQVVARILREDFARRTPEQFEAVRHQAFVLLAERFHSVDQRMQMRLSAHILELYREFLPSAHAYANFSSSLKPGEQKPFEQEDLPDLQRLMKASILGSDWQSELVDPDNYPALLDEIADQFPEGIFVVRDEKGGPLAFCAGLWLHALSMPLLERYAPGCRQMLGEEASSLHQLPPEAADTIFVLLSAVNSEHSLYRPEELGALLMQQWLVHMTRGLRGILAAADPQLNALLSVLGFQACGKVTGFAGIELTTWELDFRHTAFDQWIQRIIRQTETAAVPSAHPRENGHRPSIERSEMKEMLERLFALDKLEELPVMRRFRWSGLQVRTIIQEILADARQAGPLTAMEKEILIAGYLRKDRNKSELAASFHMSRATFYRHMRLAEQHLAYVLGDRLRQAGGASL
ncbi:bacterio-opsin activator [Paenibacillus ihbetae]|uniref:Bacterio-opsin activator n=1 Tax=Paenibacillus ihbetae TaxID=1870820 RepID=A0A1B2DYS4_9BACL|nr:bacterio-opsin activator [Paenibacillus ihbetae]ANY72777.1 bacterio-opsin activator [Paenibacillus ihbetae]